MTQHGEPTVTDWFIDGTVTTIYGNEYTRVCIGLCFSSRRRHTRWPRDWSSDVCSSDLCAGSALTLGIARNSASSLCQAGSTRPSLPTGRPLRRLVSSLGESVAEGTRRMVRLAALVALGAALVASAAPARGAPARTPRRPPANVTPPLVSGTAQAGSILTASTGTWQRSPKGYEYQWLRCASPK